MNCVFCQIISGKIPSEIYYQDNELIIFKDIKPASKIHLLAVPTQHITHIGELTKNHKVLIERLISEGKKIIEARDGNLNDIQMGFHRPPFNSVSHLHLHLIYPKSEMSYWSSFIFKPNTWWFTSVEDILHKL